MKPGKPSVLLVLLVWTRAQAKPLELVYTQIISTTAVETITQMVTETTTFSTISVTVTPLPYEPHHEFWDIDQAAAPPPFVHGYLTPGSRGSELNHRPIIQVTCIDQYKFLWNSFNITWGPVYKGPETCKRLHGTFGERGQLVSAFKCGVVGGSAEEGFTMEATGRRPVAPFSVLGSILWKAFKNYTIRYPNMGRMQLCQPEQSRISRYFEGWLMGFL